VLPSLLCFSLRWIRDHLECTEVLCPYACSPRRTEPGFASSLTPERIIPKEARFCFRLGPCHQVAPAGSFHQTENSQQQCH